MSNSCPQVVGTVLKKGDGFITVSLSDEACSGCPCSCKSSPRSVTLKTPKDFSEGDKVIIKSLRKSVVVPTLFFYGIPLCVMVFCGAVCVYGFEFGDILSAVISLLSLIPAWLVVKKISSKEPYPTVEKF